jgi:hypothetical protein
VKQKSRRIIRKVKTGRQLRERRQRRGHGGKMITLVGGVLLIVIFVSLMIVAVRKIKEKPTVKWDIESEKGEWSVNEDVISFPMSRQLTQMFLSVTILLFYVFLFSPAVANYITYTKGEPFYGMALIYMPFLVILLLFISTFFKRGLFDIFSLKLAVTLLLITMLLDLWLPYVVILGDASIVMGQGYRVSPDYVVYSFWKRVLGMEILKVGLGSLSLVWILVYPVMTVLLCALIYVIWRQKLV